MVKLGVTPMAAHMYVMYFGMLSMITPPVAIAAYAAANIARVSGWTTGWMAVRGGLEHVLHAVLVRHRAEHADERQLDGDRLEFRAQHLGIFVGTAGMVGFAFTPLPLPMRIAFGAGGLAILIPPHAFPGAECWIGPGSPAPSVLAVNCFPSRGGQASGAPKRRSRNQRS